MSDAGTSVNDFLSSFLEVLRKSSEVLYFAFNEGVTQLLYGAIDDELVRLPRLEDPLAKRIEGGLGAVTRSCAEFDREYGVSFTHGKVGAGTDVVEYEVYVFGLALVVIRIVDGRGDAESSIGPILDEWWSRVRISCVIVDDLLVRSGYYYRGCRRSDALLQRWWSRHVIGWRPRSWGEWRDLVRWRPWDGGDQWYGRRSQRGRGSRMILDFERISVGT